jgi:hypothetical protein
MLLRKLRAKYYFACVTYALDKKAVHRVRCFDLLVDLSVEVKANHIRFMKKEAKCECEERS